MFTGFEKFVEALLANLMELMPFRIIYFYQHGVRTTLGKRPKKLSPGFKLCLWLVHDILTVPNCEEVIDLPTQSITTKDKRTICFSFNVGRVVTDPVLYHSGVHDFDNSSRALIQMTLAKKLRKMTFDQAQDDMDEIEKQLKTALETLWKPWGAECTHVGMTNFVETTNVVRFLQDENVKAIPVAA